LTVPPHKMISHSAQTVSRTPLRIISTPFARPPLDDHPCRDRLRQQVEIAALDARLRKGHRRAGAVTVGDIGVDPAKALGDIGIEVVDDRVSRLGGGGEEGVADRQIEPRLLYAHRAVVAMPLAGAPAVGLGFLKVRKHLIERPSLAAALCPLVVFE
jgi:hypothetical protein